MTSGARVAGVHVFEPRRPSGAPYPRGFRTACRAATLGRSTRSAAGRLPRRTSTTRSVDELDVRRGERVYPVPAGNPLELHLATLEEHDRRGRAGTSSYTALDTSTSPPIACPATRAAKCTVLPKYCSASLIASPVWMPILTRIGGARSRKARSISSWIACAHATARRALEKASIDPSPCVPHGAAVCGRHRLDEPVVAPDDLEPGLVAEAGEHRRRVDDVGEHDRDRAIDGQRSRQVRPLALDRPLELVERDGERPAEGLQIRSRERPVDVDDLPLPSLEVEDVGRARLERLALPG